MLSSLVKLRALQWGPIDERLPIHDHAAYGVVREQGPARLLRFRRASDSAERRSVSVLLVPSLINRWTVFDLLPERSIVRTLCNQGHDVFLLDWGVARDEDRSLDWDDHVATLLRMQSVMHRITESSKSILVGYSSAGTLATIASALRPERCAGLVNIAGPIDFSKAGPMAHYTDSRWFDANALSSAGNIDPHMILSGFLALKPTQLLTDSAVLFTSMLPQATLDQRTAAAITRWAYDGVPFPAKAYATYIGALYQRNELILGKHRIGQELVKLRNIVAPLLTITAAKDIIAPTAASLALEAHVSSADCTHITAQGGHVSGLVNAHAANVVYPALLSWFDRVTQCKTV